jgi:hypothetical protein
MLSDRDGVESGEDVLDGLWGDGEGERRSCGMCGGAAWGKQDEVASESLIESYVVQYIYIPSAT